MYAVMVYRPELVEPFDDKPDPFAGIEIVAIRNHAFDELVFIEEFKVHCREIGQDPDNWVFHVEMIH